MKLNKIRRSLFLLIAAMVCFVAMSAHSAESPAATKQEIQHLLSHLENSGCQFFRNGTWYDGKAATAHLQQKYQYLLDKGMLSNAESFIEKGASESSMSGKPYLVKCGADAKPVESAVWLKSELAKYRAPGR
jgi:Spy/CpxP family protein refolding chaperone